MKKNILRISIFPLVLIITLSFTGLPPQKGNNGNKGNNENKQGSRGDHGQTNKKDQEHGNKGDNRSENSSRGSQNNGQGRSDNDEGKGRKERSENGNGNQRNHNEPGNKGKQNKHSDSDRDKKYDANDNNGLGKNKGNGKFRKEVIRWDRDENILWGFDNYTTRRRPKDYKKVSICHNTGDSDYPVSITVSENALKAHLNHGDQVGSCTINYSDRWPANYIRTRENVYNTYQTTWETMSYSEALLRFAAEKLLGLKSTFQAQRPTLSSQQIQTREALILDLQNNVNSLENQLAISRQRTEGINININL